MSENITYEPHKEILFAEELETEFTTSVLKGADEETIKFHDIMLNNGWRICEIRSLGTERYIMEGITEEVPLTMFIFYREKTVKQLDLPMN